MPPGGPARPRAAVPTRPEPASPWRVDHRSLHLFSLGNPVRRAAIALAVGENTTPLDLLNVLVLLGICIDIAGNFNQPQFQIFVNAFFTFDAVVKVVALGLWDPKGVAYLRHGWHWVDLLATLLGWVGMSPAVVNLSFVRLVRILRLLKALSAVPSVRMLASALGSSLPLLLQCLIQIGMYFVVFGVLLEQLFAGALRYRLADAMTGAPPPGDEPELPARLCSASASGRPPPPGLYCKGEQPNPGYGSVGSDNVAMAWLLTFQCITLSGWDRNMYWNWDSQGPLAPVVFVVLVGLGAFVVFNVTLTVVNESLRGVAGGSLRDAAGAAVVGAASALRRASKAVTGWVKGRRAALKAWAKGGDARDMEGYGKATALARRVAWHARYPAVESVIVSIGVVPLVVFHAGMPPALADALAALNAACVAVLLFEVALKFLAAGGFAAFFRSSLLHFIDVTALVCGIAQIIRWDPAHWPLHAPRTLRLLYLFRNSRYASFRKLLKDAVRSAGLMLAFLPMLGLYVVLGALCGMALFSGGFEGQGEVRAEYEAAGPLASSVYQRTLARASFDSFWSGAVVSVFQIMTADNWEFLMYSAMARTGTPAVFVYFVALYVVGQYLVLNGAMAVMLNSMFADYKARPAPPRFSLLRLSQRRRAPPDLRTASLSDSPARASQVPVRRRASVLASGLKGGASRPGLRRQRSMLRLPAEGRPGRRGAAARRAAPGLQRWAARARTRIAERAADAAAEAALELAREAAGVSAREGAAFLPEVEREGAGAGAASPPPAPAGPRLQQRRLSDELVNVRKTVLRGYDLHGTAPSALRRRSQSFVLDANVDLIDLVTRASMDPGPVRPRPVSARESPVQSPPRLPPEGPGPRPPTPAFAPRRGAPSPAPAPCRHPQARHRPSSSPRLDSPAPPPPAAPSAPAARSAPQPLALLAPPSPRTYRGQRALRQMRAASPRPSPAPASGISTTFAPSASAGAGAARAARGPSPPLSARSSASFGYVYTARSWATDDEGDSASDAGRASASFDYDRGASFDIDRGASIDIDRGASFDVERGRASTDAGGRPRPPLPRQKSMGLGRGLEGAARVREAREALGRKRDIRRIEERSRRPKSVLKGARCIVDAGYAVEGGEAAGPLLAMDEIQLRIEGAHSPGGKARPRSPPFSARAFAPRSSRSRLPPAAAGPQVMKALGLKRTQSMRRPAGPAPHSAGAAGSPGRTPTSPKPRSRLLEALLRPGYSLWLFPPSLPARRRLLEWIETERWDRAMTPPILVSCVLLAIEGPLLPYKVLKIVHYIDYGLTAIFVGEVLVKVFAQGFLLDRKSYLRELWNVLDLLVAIASLLTIVMSDTSDKKQSALLRGMHVLRALRPLELLSKSRAMQHALGSLSRAIPKMLRVLSLMLVLWGFYAVLGMQLFAGRIGACSDRAVERRADCRGPFLDPRTNATTERSWRTRPQTWDNVGSALLTLYEVASLRSDWTGRMRDAIDAVGVDLSMKTDHNPAASLFFLSFLVTGVFVTSNWFAAVAVTSFRRVTSESRSWFKKEGVSVKLAPDQAQWWGALKTAVERTRPRPALREPRGALRRALFRLVLHPLFDAAISALVVLNVCILCMDYHGQSAQYEEALTYTNIGFTVLFGLENLAKLAALGWGEYAAERDNLADAVVVAVCAAGAVLDAYAGGLGAQSSAASVVRVARVLRIVRVARLFPRFKSLMTLVEALASSVKATAYVGLIVLVLFFVSAPAPPPAPAPARAPCFLLHSRSLAFLSSLSLHCFPSDFRSRALRSPPSSRPSSRPSSPLGPGYAVTGVTLFGLLPIAGPLNDDANFTNAGSALLLLFRLASGDNWSVLMWYAADPRAFGAVCTAEGFGSACGVEGAPAFFVSFMVLAQYVVVNFFAAVMLDAFADVVRRRLFVVKQSDIEAFAETWRAFDPDATGYMLVAQVPALLRALGRPLGLGPADGPRAAREAMLQTLRIPTTADGRRIHFHVLLCGLVDRAYFTRGVRYPFPPSSPATPPHILVPPAPRPPLTSACTPAKEVQSHYRDRYLRESGELLAEFRTTGGFGEPHPRLPRAYAAHLLQAAWRRRPRPSRPSRPGRSERQAPEPAAGEWPAYPGTPGSLVGYVPEEPAVPQLAPHAHRD
eukprot:tig00020830_g14450.t1